MLENSQYVYLFLAVVLIGGLIYIFRPNRNKREKENSKRNPNTERATEKNIEQVENLNMVMFLLHEMAKEYSKADYDKEAVNDFVGKIIVSKSWEERLSNLPKQNDEQGI